MTTLSRCEWCGAALILQQRGHIKYRPESKQLPRKKLGRSHETTSLPRYPTLSPMETE